MGSGLLVIEWQNWAETGSYFNSALNIIVMFQISSGTALGQDIAHQRSKEGGHESDRYNSTRYHEIISHVSLPNSQHLRPIRPRSSLGLRLLSVRFEFGFSWRLEWIFQSLRGHFTRGFCCCCYSRILSWQQCFVLYLVHHCVLQDWKIFINWMN